MARKSVLVQPKRLQLDQPDECVSIDPLELVGAQIEQLELDQAEKGMLMEST